MAERMAKMLVVVATIMMVMKGIAAVNHPLVWSVTDASTYPSWAASQTFAVGDTIEFQFDLGSHTVAVVTQDGYDSCTAGAEVHADGPTTITLDKPGPFFFICTVGSHCTSGQKLSITVGGGPVADVPVADGPTAGGPAAGGPAASPTVSETTTRQSSSPPLPHGSTAFAVSFVAFVAALLF